MTHNRADASVRLPLTAEPSNEPPLTSAVTPEVIGAFVNDFYGSCRRDPLLGPIFEREVGDWDAHLARIRVFWAAALLNAGGYAGRPLEVHNAIPGLKREHFAVWLRLFREALERHCSAGDVAVILNRAGRMAKVMMGEAGVSGR